MTTQRSDSPTPGGGSYSIATYLAGDPPHEVDKADATHVAIAEYTSEGRWIRETVGTLTPQKPPPQRKAPDDADARLAALGITHDDSTESTVTFLGPNAAAGVKKAMGSLVAAAVAEEFEFNPDQPRDDHGRWTSDGGGPGSNQTLPQQQASFNDLKTQWANLDRQLLPFAGNPDDPKCKQLIQQQIDVCKQMQALNIDQGNAAGIGQPGGPRDVVVVGAGPAGLQASIYGGAEGLDTLMVDQNPQPGGQIGLTSRTENVLGFPAGVTGADLAQQGLEQAQRLGAETKLGVGVTNMSYDQSTGLKTLTMSDGSQVDARSVIIAGGVQFNTLSFPGSDSKGMVYGDSAAIKANGGPAVFVGGGNSAGQAAVDVAGNNQNVTMLVRGDPGSLNNTMSSYLTDQLNSSPNINIRYNSEIASATSNPDGSLQSVTLKDGSNLPANSVGVFIGSSPRTDWASGVTTDSHGAIVTGAAGAASALETNIPGVYAAGDVRAESMHRVVSAAGEGGTALASAWQYVNKNFGAQTAAAYRPLWTMTFAAKATPGDDFLKKVQQLDKRQPFTGYDPNAPVVGQ